jgi:threonine/homoserine/homoserine lactone efflux protein
LTLIPQFLILSEPVFAQVLVLATAHAFLIGIWLLVWTAVIGKAAETLRYAAFKPLLSRITGGALVGLGVKSAVA